MHILATPASIIPAQEAVNLLTLQSRAAIPQPTSVMAGLVPAIHANTEHTGQGDAGAAFSGANSVRVDARNKSGHDARRDALVLWCFPHGAGINKFTASKAGMQFAGRRTPVRWPLDPGFRRGGEAERLGPVSSMGSN